MSADERRSRLSVPPTLVTLSEFAWRSGLLVVAVLAAAWLFFELRVLTVAASVALLVAALLMPVVDWLRRHRWPDLFATWAVVLAGFLVVGGVVAVITPPFISELADLGEQFDDGIDELETWLTTGPLGLEDVDLRAWFDSAADRVADTSASQIMSGVTLAVEIVTGFFLALVMTFFLLKDGPRIVSWAGERIPRLRDERVAGACTASWRSLSAYIRGTAVVGVVDAVFIGIGLWIIGVPLVLPLAVLTFFAAFFPFVGAIAAGALAALVALAANGPVDALLVLGLTVVVQQVEGDVVAPVVVGRALRLHPLVVLMAVTAGAVLGGIPGAFLAVPFTGATVAAVSAWRSPDV